MIVLAGIGAGRLGRHARRPAEDHAQRSVSVQPVGEVRVIGQADQVKPRAVGLFGVPHRRVEVKNV
ncbi:hypothetical protein ABT256_17245 [Amycolatopsis japonica]|uniref:hypothetical protein n=1 Tax=Amycolatopsis japonica TaxID=208439 RepID=UPI003316696C